MEFDSFNKIMLAAASTMFGGFFGLLRTKMANPNGKQLFRNIAYGLASGIILFAVFSFFWNKAEILHQPEGRNTYAIILHLAAGLGSVAVILFTYFFYNDKDVYTTKQLNPIINNWTKAVQNSELRLICGDMNFLGMSSSEIDGHPQYIALKQSQFSDILILCRPPVNAEQESRYGKILSELEHVTMKFYDPKSADLSIRGRIGVQSGVEKLIIYRKLDYEKYQTVETDAGNSEGALIKNIWALVWELSTPVSGEKINRYITRFKS